jgi:hypothetical protein
VNRSSSIGQDGFTVSLQTDFLLLISTIDWQECISSNMLMGEDAVSPLEDGVWVMAVHARMTSK